jgi:hypothetical protein
MYSASLLCTVWSEITSAVLVAPLPCVGPGDVDASSLVDAADWALLAPCMNGANQSEPPPGCALETFEYADVEFDGDVDLRDAAAFQNVYLDDYFDYGPYLEDKEAERVALDFTDELKAPVALYERVRQDLLTIREEFPEYEEYTYNGSGNARRLIVSPVDGAWSSVLDELVRYYQAEVLRCGRGWCGLSFCDQLNMPVMAALWEELPEVDYATPSYYLYPASCPSGSLWIEMPYHKLIYDFSCCDDTWCWRTLSFEMSESSEILSIIVSHPYGCEPDCP